MEIGETEEVFTTEPAEDPFEVPAPDTTPAPETAPAEPEKVPA